MIQEKEINIFRLDSGWKNLCHPRLLDNSWRLMNWSPEFFLPIYIRMSLSMWHYQGEWYFWAGSRTGLISCWYRFINKTEDCSSSHFGLVGTWLSWMVKRWILYAFVCFCSYSAIQTGFWCRRSRSGSGRKGGALVGWGEAIREDAPWSFPGFFWFQLGIFGKWTS